jgi:hypothetical protein
MHMAQADRTITRMNVRRPRICSIPGCGNPVKIGAFKYCSIRCSHVAQKKDYIRRSSVDSSAARLDGCKCSPLDYARGHTYRCKVEAFFLRGGVHGYVESHFLARALRDYYGERCLRCGWSRRHPKTGRVPVEVEHIDGDWENNRLTNLTLLCPNCHSLTPTFRALNRGRGRLHRLESGDPDAKTAPMQEATKGSIGKGSQAQPRQLQPVTADVAQLARARTL